MTIMRTVFVCAALTAIVGILAAGSPREAASRRVSGNLVFWDQSRGFDAIADNPDIFTEISPFWYRVLSDGRVVPYTTASGGSYEDPAIISFLRAHDIQIIPTVANIIDGVWDGAAVRAVISDPRLRAFNISTLVGLARAKGYDGIDLDYEDLRSTDRAAYTTFVQELAAALHADGKLLTVNVYAKTSEPGGWDGPQAQDWRAIGQVADQVRIMTYEYSWSTSPPGPISPVSWVNDVIAFARTHIPAAKIVQGIPFYGYDWVGQRGTELAWNQAAALATQHAVSIRWDAASASPWFEYMSGGTRHTVWFENGSSVDAKLGVTLSHDIGGVALWRLGGEDPRNWQALRARFGGAPPAADVTPPSVAITSPADGGYLARKQLIEAQVTDDVRVARVEFYANGSLLASDTSSPYSVWWNTQRAPRGSSVIDVRAYDTSGNHASDRAVVFSLR